MKVVLLFIFISLFLISNGQVKQSPSKEEDVTKVLCQKWMLTSISSQDRSETIPRSEAMYLTYYSDSSYTDSSARYGVVHGSWVYNKHTKYLSTDEKGGNEKAKIVKLTTSELVFEIEYPSVTMLATYKRVESDEK